MNNFKRRGVKFHAAVGLRKSNILRRGEEVGKKTARTTQNIQTITKVQGGTKGKLCPLKVFSGLTLCYCCWSWW
jgi:hypothetical protein